MKRFDELQPGDVFYLPRECDAFDILHDVSFDRLNANGYIREDLIQLFIVKYVIQDVYDDHIYTYV